MKNFKYIVLFLLFVNSLLFATIVNVSFGVGVGGFSLNSKILYTDQYNNNYILTFITSSNVITGAASTDAVFQTETIDLSTGVYIYTQSDGTTYSENRQKFTYQNSVSCISPKVLDINTNSCLDPVLTCTDKQYLDSNNTCQQIVIPPGFPDSSKKGIPGIRESNTTAPADCIVGTKISTGIAYAEIIGYNYQTHACIYSTFFCNNGLTWDKLSGTCEVPPDNANFNPNTGEISPGLASACKSDNWAKSWTYDYCGQPLCYIGLDVQDYNLQCNNKYIEYDCTSDYRVKIFKQVSCGDVAESDFNHNTLNISSPTDYVPSNVNDSNITGNPNVTTTTNPDNNTSTTDYSGVVSIINGTLKNIDESASGLVSGVSSLNQKLSNTNSKLGSIDGKLDGISNKLDDIKNALNPAPEGDGGAFDKGFSDISSLGADVKNYFNQIGNKFDSTKSLFSSGFHYSPPSVGACVDPSVFVYGRKIELSICEPFQTFSPIFYLISTAVFTYAAISIFIFALSL